MTTPIYDIAHMDTLIVSSQAAGIERLLVPAVPEFIGALAATLVSTVIACALKKRRKHNLPESSDENSRS
ncbi:hypothetical protein ABZ769_30470 [Streptomyces olivoreticuli]